MTYHYSLSDIILIFSAMTNKPDQSRRRFISNSAMAAIGTIGVAQLLTSCKDGISKKKEIKLPELLRQAPEQEQL
jgi:hypothetical protein